MPKSLSAGGRVRTTMRGGGNLRPGLSAGQGAFPNGAYAGVIPRWVAAILAGQPCVINGDGETSRDFCYVANAVQANLRSALVDDANAIGQVYNVAVGQRTTLTELHALIGATLREWNRDLQVAPPQFSAFRDGDVRHSLADIGKARALLAYEPTHDVRSGMREAVGWYIDNLAR